MKIKKVYFITLPLKYAYARVTNAYVRVRNFNLITLKTWPSLQIFELFPIIQLISDILIPLFELQVFFIFIFILLVRSTDTFRARILFRLWTELKMLLWIYNNGFFFFFDMILSKLFARILDHETSFLAIN